MVVIIFTREGTVSGVMVVTSGSRVPVSVTSCDVTVVRLLNATVVPAGSVTLPVTWSETV